MRGDADTAEWRSAVQEEEEAQEAVEEAVEEAVDEAEGAPGFEEEGEEERGGQELGLQEEVDPVEQAEALGLA